MLRFTIRDLLWLMVVAGMACALLFNTRRMVATNRALSEQNSVLLEELRVAREESDKAWAAAHDPFYRHNPLDDLWRKPKPNRLP